MQQDDESVVNRFVLDTSVFFLDLPLRGELYVPERVVHELKDLRSKARYEHLITEGLIVCEPLQKDQRLVIQASKDTGDYGVLSETDIDVLALALTMTAEVVTDDYAVQNTAQKLGLKTHSILQRPAVKRQWRYRCSGCGKYYQSLPSDETCEICGAVIKRKIK